MTNYQLHLVVPQLEAVAANVLPAARTALARESWLPIVRGSLAVLGDLGLDP